MRPVLCHTTATVAFDRTSPRTSTPRALPPAIAGLWGAAFNSGRMTLWRVRASKTRHVLRIAEVIGLAILVQVGPRSAHQP